MFFITISGLGLISLLGFLLELFLGDGDLGLAFYLFGDMHLVHTNPSHSKRLFYL